MNGPHLTERRSPWVVFTVSDDPWLAAETTRLQDKGGLVFRLNGNDLLEPILLFRVFARELDFPDYFGHNWDALVDCLSAWHGPGHGMRDVAILIEDADALLDAEFLGLFVAVLCQAAWNANLRLDADGVRHESWPPFSLHFVFVLKHTSPAAFIQAAATGKDVVITQSEGRLFAALTSEEWPGDPLWRQE